MGNQEDITYWNIPVPKPLNEALEAAIKRNWHRTKAEFIRELVRQELKKRGFHAPGEHPITFEE
jgi:metal-responsive CopG/Arc/MetJ family transcriptional regulator